MKSRYYYYDNGSYGMETEELPKLEENQFLLKAIITQLSVGTETAMNTGKARIMKGRHGYSFVGEVVEMGKDVKDVKMGDRIACQKNHGDYTIMTSGASHWGAYYHIPDAVSNEAATFLSLGLVSLYVIERAKLSLGQTMVVVGLGTVGQMAAQLARLNGAGCVIGIDLETRKQEMAVKLGANIAINSDSNELNKALELSLQNSPAPTFADVTGSSKAVEWIMENSKPKSRIVIAGAYKENITFDPWLIMRWERDLVGAFQPSCPNGFQTHYPYNKELNNYQLLRFMEKKQLNVDDLYDVIIKPDEVIDFYDKCRDGKPRPAQPLVDWK